MTLTMTRSIISHDGNDRILGLTPCVKSASEYEISIFSDKMFALKG
jgi:hypothetical protein